MKLKDLLEAGYNIKQGQVFTMKDCPPFKTPAQIEEESLQEVKGFGPNSIAKGESYKIDGTNDIVTIISVVRDKPSNRHDTVSQSSDYTVTVKFKTGKKDTWYLDKSDTMFVPHTVNEVTYPEFKNDDSLTSRQKVGEGIKEMNSLLFKMEQLIRQTSKLKTETGMDPAQYWKSTQRKMEGVTTRVVKIARYLQELKKESESLNEVFGPIYFKNQSKDLKSILSGWSINFTSNKHGDDFIIAEPKNSDSYITITINGSWEYTDSGKYTYDVVVRSGDESELFSTENLSWGVTKQVLKKVKTFNLK